MRCSGPAASSPAVANAARRRRPHAARSPLPLATIGTTALALSTPRRARREACRGRSPRAPGGRDVTESLRRWHPCWCVLLAFVETHGYEPGAFTYLRRYVLESA